MIWIVLAFIFSNLFSFIFGYIILTAFIKVVDRLGEKDNDKEETTS